MIIVEIKGADVNTRIQLGCAGPLPALTMWLDEQGYQYTEYAVDMPLELSRAEKMRGEQVLKEFSL